MPIDMGSIAAVGTSLQSAGEIIKAMVGLRDGAMIQAKVIELQAVILSAQGAALAANANQFTLLERVRELEKEIADMKAWDTEKQKYHLKEISPGVLAYVLKADAEPTSPGHWLCTTCYEQRRKSILQYIGEPKAGARIESVFGCNACKSQVLVFWDRQSVSVR